MSKALLTVVMAIFAIGVLIEFSTIFGLIGWKGLLILLAIGAVWSAVDAARNRWSLRRKQPDRGEPRAG